MKPYKGQCSISCMRKTCAFGKIRIDFACLNCEHRRLEILNLQDDVLVSLETSKKEKPKKNKVKKEE
uniref:Uncharacterized protein n=1 Tax=viral metagenome TaxID=1070528 RepID=A0A6M3K2J0_9ZZZZ